MMQVVIPTGLAPGAAFTVQTPDGQMMQVVVPPTSKGGDTIAIQPVERVLPVGATIAPAPQAMQRSELEA